MAFTRGFFQPVTISNINIDQDACMAGPGALAELPENGKISSFTISIEYH
jgi:hypothetical protein